MQLIADFLLAAGALSAGIYCLVLSRRLASFARLESGMGGAIAVLSVQVDEMTRALERARGTASDSASALEGRTRRAEEVAERLDLILATMHDLPEPGPVRRRLRRQPRQRSEEEVEA
ncbi:DUF6468 domain-containing protein [Frigidibacter sp. MR17.24]|uniref:DUF6468 domain-containing protein n=1 Tax=Frigidibacter sp. MR17.24 TaxID=3127345 RepID=UPI003012CB35